MNRADQDKYTEHILNSMQGSERARPRPDLFAKIENVILNDDRKIWVMKYWKLQVAAAILILVMNTTVLTVYNQNRELENINLSSANAYNHELISTFQIYE
ncbi:MAG: hypothetical protein AAGA77_09095 [Bacteroidota bacterium]